MEENVEVEATIEPDDVYNDNNELEVEGGKKKRAASKKCSALLREALYEERKQATKKPVPQVSVTKAAKAKSKKTAGNAEKPARKKTRNYSAVRSRSLHCALHTLYGYSKS